MELKGDANLQKRKSTQYEEMFHLPESSTKTLMYI